MKGILDLIKQAESNMFMPLVESFAKANGIVVGENDNELSVDEVLTKMQSTEEFLYSKFTGTTYDGTEVRNLPALKLEEALTTSDVSILMPRVINNILGQPREPNLFLQNQVAEVISLPWDSPLSVEFPVMDAMDAIEMAEGQEYQAGTQGFAMQTISMKLRKVGRAAAISEETIKSSQWPIVTLHLKAIANAINRLVEGFLWTCMKNFSQVVFDNDNASGTWHTTGKKIASAAAVNNGTFSYHDLVKMCSVLLGNRYDATHFITHPLAWSIFAQDPILRAQFYHAGQMGAGIWTRMPQFDQSASMPFGIAYVPYYNIPFTEGDTFTNALSGEAAATTADIYVIDRANSLFLATRGDIEMDEKENWFRDAKMIKAKKYCATSAKDGGKGMVKATKIRLDLNSEPLFNVGTVTS